MPSDAAVPGSGQSGAGRAAGLRIAVVAEVIVTREHLMLKSVGKPALLVKLGVWRCMCMRKKALNAVLLSRIRRFDLLGLACWCDRSDGV